MVVTGSEDLRTWALNESPSEKEGKSECQGLDISSRSTPLNESPSEKEGKWLVYGVLCACCDSLNESPSEKEGKLIHIMRNGFMTLPSMKVPPKRKGNICSTL